MPLEKQGKKVCTRDPERRVHDIEASDPEDGEREDYHSGVYTVGN